MHNYVFIFGCLFIAKSAIASEIFDNLHNINLNVTALSLNARQIAPFDEDSIVCSDLGISLDGKNVSSACARQVEIVCNNRTLLWTMFDASSKFPYTGLTFSTRQDLGNYDECLTIDHTEGGFRVLGKHCAFGLLIPDVSIGFDNMTEVINNAYKLSICIPDSCTIADLTAATGYPLLTDLYCSTKETDTKYDTGDITVLVVFCAFGCIMILSTIYDIYTQKTERKQTPLFVAFSVMTNGQKLLHTSSVTNREQILSFHGIKAISMMWIVAGHGFVAWESYPVSNQQLVSEWLKQRYAQYINSAHLAVDTFFFMSGFLMAYQYLKGKPANAKVHILRVPQLYLHRYLRLTPALAMLYFFNITLNKHMVRGPLAPRINEDLNEPCKKYWYSFFLYIQNYYNYDNLCYTQTWYLSADMQMFVIAPLVMIPVALLAKVRFKATMIGMLVLNMVVTIIPIVISLEYRDYQNDYNTHSRFIDYFCGFMLGVYMREQKDVRFQFSKIVNLILWALSILGMLAVILVYQEEYMNGTYESQSVYYGLMRPAWSLCLAWIVYSCHHGHGGFVNWILCSPICQVGSRLTYCMYLVHGNVIVWYLLLVQNKVHFSDYEAFYLFSGNFMVTIILAIAWSLAFESPLMTIEKIIFGRTERKPRVHVSKTEPVP